MVSNNCVKKSLHTILDQIVKDSYISLSENLKGQFYFSGGLSIQFFLPKTLYRDSSDIDTEGLERLNYSAFRESFKETLETLSEKGYSYKTSKKQSSTFDAVIEGNHDKLMLQYPKKSKSNYEWIRRVCEREYSNSSNILLDGYKIKIISPEDIVVHKFHRAERFISEYNLIIPKNKNFFDMKEKINEMKVDILLNNFNIEPSEISKKIAKIRLYADLFDINALSVYKKLDKNYLLEVFNDFDDLKGKYSKLENELYEINPNVFG